METLSSFIGMQKKRKEKKGVSKLGVINESDFPSSTGSARREGGDCFASDSLLLERKVSSVVEDQCSSTGRKPGGRRFEVKSAVTRFHQERDLLLSYIQELRPRCNPNQNRFIFAVTVLSQHWWLLGRSDFEQISHILSSPIMGCHEVLLGFAGLRNV